jgi:hypothetical protein
MTPAELVAESRKRQGLEPKVTDAGTLAKVAVLLRGGGRRAT